MFGALLADELCLCSIKTVRSHVWILRLLSAVSVTDSLNCDRLFCADLNLLRVLGQRLRVETADVCCELLIRADSWTKRANFQVFKRGNKSSVCRGTDALVGWCMLISLCGRNKRGQLGYTEPDRPARQPQALLEPLIRITDTNTHVLPWCDYKCVCMERYS